MQSQPYESQTRYIFDSRKHSHGQDISIEAIAEVSRVTSWSKRPIRWERIFLFYHFMSIRLILLFNWAAWMETLQRVKIACSFLYSISHLQEIVPVVDSRFFSLSLPLSYSVYTKQPLSFLRIMSNINIIIIIIIIIVIYYYTSFCRNTKIVGWWWWRHEYCMKFGCRLLFVRTATLTVVSLLPSSSLRLTRHCLLLFTY